MSRERLVSALARCPKAPLALLPTPLERGPDLPGGAHLYVKRDDLTGLGMGGNKARKLEYLCGDALARESDVLITVGAAQSNHARITAAAGAALGIETHVVLGGPPVEAGGNQLLTRLFGAELHYPGTDDWDELEEAMDELASDLARQGRHPYRMPIGGSTAVGACGFAAAWLELLGDCERFDLDVSAIVHASSSGGTHAGLLAGRRVWSGATAVPDLLAIGVAKTSVSLMREAREIANGCLRRLGFEDMEVDDDQIEVDGRWRGRDYAFPTPDGDRAVRWAAQRGAWVLDRTYTGKALAGLLGAAEEGRFAAGQTVLFWHTGGQPAVFASEGAPIDERAGTLRVGTEAMAP